MITRRFGLIVVALSILVVAALTVRNNVTTSASADTGSLSANAAQGTVAPQPRQELVDLAAASDVSRPDPAQVQRVAGQSYQIPTGPFTGPRTLRDQIPSNFIYPLASDLEPASIALARMRAEIPSAFIQPVVPFDPGAVNADDYTLAARPHTLRDEIPSEFIYPLSVDTGR